MVTDEAGIVIVGKDSDGHGYVLADLSGRYFPGHRHLNPPSALADKFAGSSVLRLRFVNNVALLPVSTICSPRPLAHRANRLDATKAAATAFRYADHAELQGMSTQSRARAEPSPTCL
jgi:hypothetical protein